MIALSMRRLLAAVALSLVCMTALADKPLLNAPFIPDVHSQRFGERTLVWSELGDPNGRPLVFAVGFPHAASTGSGVLGPYDEFLRRNHVRLIAVERTGATHRSSYDPNDTLDDYVADVETLTEYLGIDRFAVMAFSAGGPGALALAVQLGERVRSLHLVAARGRYTAEIAARTGEEFAFSTLINDPEGFAPFFQAFPPPRFFLDPADVEFLDANFGSDFLDVYFATAVAELNQNPAGLSASRAIGYQPWSFELADVVAPVFIYQGWGDLSILPAGYPQDTSSRVGGPVAVRFYAGESHFETHLRHFDQVIADMTHFGKRLILCVPGRHPGNRRTRDVAVRRVADLLRRGATVGNCAWQ